MGVGPSREELREGENLDGLSEEQLETFRHRAVPEPGGVLREGAELTNDTRLDIPTTVICTGFTSEQLKAYAEEHNPAWLGGLAELRDAAGRARPRRSAKPACSASDSLSIVAPQLSQRTNQSSIRSADAQLRQKLPGTVAASGLTTQPCYAILQRSRPRPHPSQRAGASTSRFTGSPITPIPQPTEDRRRLPEGRSGPALIGITNSGLSTAPGL
jgi:hypothetical protein